MDWRETQVDPGASVEAADGPLGTVEDVVVDPQTRAVSHLVARRGSTTERVTIPMTAVAEVPNRHVVRLRVRRDELTAMTSRARSEVGSMRAATTNRDEIRVPVLEERLDVATRPTELGEVRLHKTIELFEQVARQPVLREDVIVERVEMHRELDAPLEPHMDGDWFVVPIMEEMLVVQKRLVLKEEVRIKKRQVTEEYEVREQLRREHLDVEDATTHGIGGSDGAAYRRGTTAGRASVHAADTRTTGDVTVDDMRADNATSPTSTTPGAGAGRR
jgi:uncharacterized protein (TIGR02271 family)